MTRSGTKPGELSRLDCSGGFATCASRHFVVCCLRVNLRPSITARSRLVIALTEEILAREEEAAFAIASEHELCRRFQISRVTVRLALADLENRGLIYRKHGKGTFAHGRAKQMHRDIGFLMKLPQTAIHRPIAEMIRGAQTIMAPLRAAVVLLSRSPGEWRADIARNMGGVIVVPDEVTAADLQMLQDRNVPYLLAHQAALPGSRIDLGQRRAARIRTEELLELGHRRIALLSGFDASLDSIKREGIHDALDAAGIDPAGVPEFFASDESAVVPVARELLGRQPRPTAVIAFDDGLAAILSCHARQQARLHIPQDLSIVGFHDWPSLHCLEPALSTVKFEFFTAGQRAAEALTHSAVTGQPVPNLSFEPTYRNGESVGPVPSDTMTRDRSESSTGPQTRPEALR